jgi:septum formation protein
MENRPIVLGSTSRYRKALLARLGVQFETAAPNVDESPRQGEAPAVTCERLGRAQGPRGAPPFRRARGVG